MTQNRDVSEEAVYMLGYYARVQTLIEMLVQLRLRQLPDVRDGLGPAYFDQMSDASRKRWLKSLGTAAVDQPLGSRLESVYAQVADVRNHISHAPLNIHLNADDNPDEIRVGSTRWMDKPLPSPADISLAQARLLWLELWIVWLLAGLETVKPFQKREGSWETLEPERPPLTPPR